MFFHTVPLIQQPVTDSAGFSLVPDVTRIDKKIRREAEEFYGSVFPENFSFGASGVKRAASSAAKGPSKKAKEDISNIDAKELARTDQVMKVWMFCRTALDSDVLTVVKKLSLSLEFAIEITPIIPYIGVVFSFMDHYC